MILCPNGHPNEDTADFCTVCHAYLGWKKPAEPTPPQPTTPAGPGPAPVASVSAMLSPTQLAVAPGQAASAQLRVRNTGTVVDEYAVQIEGAGTTWITPTPMTLSLLPGAEGTVAIDLRPPHSPEVAAGSLAFTVRVVSRTDLSASQLIPATVQVAPYGELTATLAPQTSRSRSGATHTLSLANAGNAAVTAALAGTDPEGALGFELSPSSLSVPPGASASSSVGVKAPKMIWWGTPQPHPFTLTASPPDPAPPVSVQGTFIQQPVAPKWVTAIVPLVVVALGFLGVRAAVGGGGGGGGSGGATTSPTQTTTVTTPALVSLTIGGFDPQVWSGSYITAPGLHCPSVCSHEYPVGTSVTLTGHYGDGYNIVLWGLPQCESSDTCTIVLDSDLTVNPEFD